MNKNNNYNYNYVTFEHAFEIIATEDHELGEHMEAAGYESSFGFNEADYWADSEHRGCCKYISNGVKMEAKHQVMVQAREARTPLEWRTMRHYVTKAVLRSRKTGKPLHCVKLNRALLEALADALRELSRRGRVRSYSLRPLAEELHHRPDRAMVWEKLDDYILVNEEVASRDLFDWHYFYEEEED